MIIKGIKRGKSIELLEEIGIPDNQEIIIEISEPQEVAGNNAKFSFWQSLEKFRNEVLEDLEIQPEIFADLRDKSSGGEAVW